MRALWILSLVGAVLIFCWGCFVLPGIFLTLGCVLLAPGAAAFAITLHERSMQP